MDHKFVEDTHLPKPDGLFKYEEYCETDIVDAMKRQCHPPDNRVPAVWRISSASIQAPSQADGVFQQVRSDIKEQAGLFNAFS